MFKTLLVSSLPMLLAGVASAAALTVHGDQFHLDGKPFDMWGIRTASATKSEELTRQLIENLSHYKQYGVNTISVYYMGSSAAYGDPFSPDGATIDKAEQNRMDRIIREADQRGMVVVVGIFYQRADSPRLRDWEAATRAIRTVTEQLRPHRNVILNIANEQNSARYATLPWSRVNNPEDVVALCKLAKSLDLARIVGAGGYDHTRNEIIGSSAAVDVLLFDTNGPASSGQLYQRFLAAGVKNKPMVNVETFGAWTNQFDRPGVFPAYPREAYLREIDEAARHRGLYVHLHNSPWLQGEKIRYDLGGAGTESDPGIRWYFEAVQAARGGRNVANTYYPSPDSQGGWRKVDDARQARQLFGIDRKKLDEAFEVARASSKNGGLLVLHDGWLVYERYFGRGHREATANLASIGKSFTSIATGILMGERPELFPDRLDQKVFTEKFFPPAAFPLSDAKRANIKLGQLLTFKAGIRGNNPGTSDGSEVKLDPAGPDGWAAMIDEVTFGREDIEYQGRRVSTESLWCEPGAGYSYASASAHLASVMLRHVSGRGTSAVSGRTPGKTTWLGAMELRIQAASAGNAHSRRRSNCRAAHRHTAVWLSSTEPWQVGRQTDCSGVVCRSCQPEVAV